MILVDDKQVEALESRRIAEEQDQLNVSMLYWSHCIHEAYDILRSGTDNNISKSLRQPTPHSSLPRQIAVHQ